MKVNPWSAHVVALAKIVELRSEEEDDALNELLSAQDLRTPAYKRDKACQSFYFARETTRLAIRAHEHAMANHVHRTPYSPEQARGCATKII